MVKDLPGFDNNVIGSAAGIFFWGYLLLEIPGSLLVERWSARKWIARIMFTWGIIAACQALVKTSFQFYTVRFFLGLAEAGFYPGVIVYLTHWFPGRHRGRALAYFLVATPMAQIISPKISNWLLKMGTTEVVNGVVVHHATWMGIKGWQWVFIGWGIPAVVMGVVVFLFLTDRPRHARWLTDAEREALEAELEREMALARGKRHVPLLEALRHPKVVLLALAYLFAVTANYGIEFFFPSILRDWYHLRSDTITTLMVIPPMMALVGQLVVGWSSDRTQERRFHSVGPLVVGALALAIVPFTRGNLALSVLLFAFIAFGVKAYLPPFWTLPNLFLTEAAAAGSIGLINSLGNLGGYVGPKVLGKVQTVTGSFAPGIFFLAVSMALASAIVLYLGLGRRDR
jgi:ACS family tartrate transporter-like MFS transporter